mgnify:CR=1 FL=1
MKYLINKSNVELFEDAYPATITITDSRPHRTFEGYHRIYNESFLDRGYNHRENHELGSIERDVDIEVWFVEINSLDELHRISEQYGMILYGEVFGRPYMYISPTTGMYDV